MSLELKSNDIGLHMELSFFNPWWKDGKISPSLTGRRRAIFDEVIAFLDKRQIILLTGLRRVGKTTLIYQIIDELLKKGVEPYNILYFSFDETKYDLESMINQYELDVLQGNISGRKIFLFLDEIQKLEGWASKIKILYDAHPELKIYLSGSARIKMWKETRESLAGRFFDFLVAPLSFDEYLDFKGIAIDKNREKVFENEIKLSMASYLASGGFIEALDFDDRTLKRYIRESLLERVAFVDIPQSFKVGMPELLFKLISIAASNTGLYLDFKNLGNDLNIDQRTIASYISYLEYALFCQKLYNYSTNLLTTEKKMKRLYLSNTAFTIAMNQKVELPSVLEQFFVNLLGARFFLRTPQKEEIDIIYTAGNMVLPIEIKIRETIAKTDLKPLFRFLERYTLNEALMITLNTEALYESADRTIKAIPYWRYWTISRFLVTMTGDESRNKGQ
jgi:predicted AAA+ superfamily ATPase